ncbi:MAG: GTPase Era, partial [Eubacteriales bacterium]|nr:GTPase Era [Eubacteriales bacterium]
VGKSTLLNAMVGEKVAIVSNKPQTTRNRIMGICTQPGSQIVFLDTPGMHQPRTKLGDYMMQTVRESMDGVDALLALVDATQVGKQDREIITQLSKRKVKKLLVLNKIDLLKKEALLSLMQEFSELGYDAIVPVSALTGDGVEELRALIEGFLPEGPRYFPDDSYTDQPERQICAELIREKALLHLKDEVPHGIGVEIISLKEVSPTLTQIDATIYCERDAHKGIIIGRQGAMLKLIGQEARADIEALLDTQVNLKLWVKVREGWRDRRDDLRMLGYVKQD